MMVTYIEVRLEILIARAGQGWAAYLCAECNVYTHVTYTPTASYDNNVNVPSPSLSTDLTHIIHFDYTV